MNFLTSLFKNLPSNIRTLGLSLKSNYIENAENYRYLKESFENISHGLKSLKLDLEGNNIGE